MALCKKTFFALLMLLVMSVLILSGCGSSSPTAGGGGNTGPATGGGTISGFIYSLIDQTQPNLSTPLSGATIVADNASTSSAVNGSYTISGLGGTATISAAKAGYWAQTLAGVPTTSGQDVHLNPLLTPPPGASSSTSITGTVTSGGIGVPFAWVNCQDATGSIYGSAIADALGAYNIPVTFWNGATTGNVTIYSAASNMMTLDTTAFGYTTVNISANTPAVAPAIVQTAVTNSPMSVTVANIPAGANNGFIAIQMKLPTGVNIPAGAFSFIGNASGTAVPTVLNINVPNNIPGVSYSVMASYNDWYTTNISTTLDAFAWRANLPIANLTINLLNMPTLTSPTTIAAANPSTFSWNAVPGAAQYTIALSGAGYGWQGDTTATSITKPLFIPANGGNLTAGFIYSGRLSVSDVPIVGATTNTTTPMNPLQQSSSVQASHPSAYTWNPSWSGNYTISTSNVTITAN